MWEGVQAPGRFEPGLVGCHEDHPGSAERERDHAFCDCTGSNRAGGLIAAAGHNGCSLRQTGSGRCGTADRAGYLRSFKCGRQQRTIDVQGVEQFARPVPGGKVKQDRPSGSGLVSRVLSG